MAPLIARKTKIAEQELDVVEVSAGVYRVSGSDRQGRDIELIGTDPDALLEQCDRNRTEDVMNRSELREWLGITPADALVYLGVAALAAMYFFESVAADVGLAVVAVVSTVAACPLGMKRHPEVSGFTNGVKVVIYPICAAVAVLLVWIQVIAARG